MEPNTIFMWTAGAAATITSALAIRAAWTQYNAAIADANTLRFQLQRAHTLVDQMTDQVAAMNRTIGELRSELKTAKAKQAVADIDAKAAKQKTWAQVSMTPTPTRDTLKAAQAHVKAGKRTRATQWSGLWLPSPNAQGYKMIFSSGKLEDWIAHVPWHAVNAAAKNTHKTGNITSHSDGGSFRFMVQYRRVRYCTPYFANHAEAVLFRRELLRAFNLKPEVQL
jgi:hypothetical protein